MEASPRKRSHKEVSLQLKYYALMELENGKTNKEVGLMFEVPPNTISTWKKNKSKIFEAFQNGCPAKKRLRVDKFDQINKAILQWFKQKQMENVPVNRTLLKEKALSFAKEMGVENFHASSGWIEKWKKRYGVTLNTASGKVKSETIEIMTPSMAPLVESTLPMLISRYVLKDIFNAKEFGLFYQYLPSKTSHQEKSTNGKQSNVSLTGVAVGNAFGERFEMFVIGKHVDPCSFEDLKNIPCRYRVQKKGWMDSGLFEEWVLDLDTKFGAIERKIALIINDCSAHPEVPGLQWVELFFLPSNSGSIMHPMDQGIIKSLKAKYRSLTIKKHILTLEKNYELSKFSILTAMTLLQEAWDSVPSHTFTSSFRKAGLLLEASEQALYNEDDKFTMNALNELKTDLKKLKDNFRLDYLLTAEELVDIDSQLSVSGTLSDADIISEVYGNCVDLSDNEGGNDEPEEKLLVKPSMSAVLAAINTLEDYSLFSKYGTDIMTALKDINRAVDLENQLGNRPPINEDQRS